MINIDIVNFDGENRHCACGCHVWVTHWVCCGVLEHSLRYLNLGKKMPIQFNYPSGFIPMDCVYVVRGNASARMALYSKPKIASSTTKPFLHRQKFNFFFLHTTPIIFCGYAMFWSSYTFFFIDFIPGSVFACTLSRVCVWMSSTNLSR